MYRVTALLVAVLAVGLPLASGIEIEQENENLELGPDWTFLSNGTIIIKQAHSDETFVFWAHEDGQPTVLAEVLTIERDTVNLTSGTIKVQVSKSGGPGATNIGKITFDDENITSIIEGIEITGDLFTVAASTVDHVTGPIEVGGSLTAGLTVNDDLEGAVTIEGAIATGADVEILGNVLEPISIGTYIPNRTASSYDSISAVSAPITIAGDLAALSGWHA